MAKSNDTAKLDAQEKAMTELAQAIKETKALMAQPSREVRSWRMLVRNWSRGVVTMTQAQRENEAQAYHQAKLSAEKANDLLAELEGGADYDRAQRFVDMAEDIDQALNGADMTPDQKAKVLARLQHWVSDLQEWQTGYRSYLQAVEAYQEYERQEAQAKADYQAELEDYQAQRQEKAHARTDLRALTGTGMPVSAVKRYSEGLAAYDEASHQAVPDEDACFDEAKATIYDYPDGFDKEKPNWLDDQTADQATELLRQGDRTGAVQALVPSLMKAVDELMVDVNYYLSELATPAPEKPKKKYVDPVPKPRPYRKFQSIKLAEIPAPKPPKALTHEVVDQAQLEELMSYAKGPYEQTTSHAVEIDELAKRLGAPALGLTQPRFDQVADQTGLREKVRAVITSHEAFGSQRHSTHGSRLISRLESALEVLEGVSDLDGLKVAERRFLSVQHELLSWVSAKWWEKGGVPDADKTLMTYKTQKWMLK